MPETLTLPATVPIFPLSGALLLPGSDLRLNIFEPRYVAMIDDVMRDHRLIGMVQPREQGGERVFEIGCAGRIFEYRETEDSRYLITLKGIQRFAISQELPCMRGYRLVQPDWSRFAGDRQEPSDFMLDRPRLISLLRRYFDRLQIEADWSLIEQAPALGLIDNLAMACPFENGEKQAILEAEGPQGRAEVLMTLLEMAIAGPDDDSEQTPQ